MENLTDKDLLYLAQHCPKAILITCIGIALFIWLVVLAISNFKQIARMKVDCEKHIEEMKEFNNRKPFK
jgi:hypothetical protein